MRPRPKPEQLTHEYWLRRHLTKLGCSKEQVERHLARGKALPTDKSKARTSPTARPRLPSLLRYSNK
jgi:hypothetical protein